MKLDIGSIKTEALNARTFLKNHNNEICSSELAEFPKGSCGFACALLRRWLTEERKIEGITNVSSTQGHSHEWLQIGGYIIDITLDQFSNSKEIVLASRESDFHEQLKGKPTPPIINGSAYLRSKGLMKNL